MGERERFRDPETKTLLDKYGIHLGVPLEKLNGLPVEARTWEITVPQKPHVFYCHHLFLLISSKNLNQELSIIKEKNNFFINEVSGKPLVTHVPIEIISTLDNSNGQAVVSPAVHLTGAMIMLGHGFSFNSTSNGWISRGTGLPISDIVATINDIALKENWPLLDAVIFCRPNVLHKETEQATIRFQRYLAPSMVSNSSATVHRSLAGYPSQYNQSKGTCLTVSCDSWVNIAYWLGYRQYQVQFEQFIPPPPPYWALQTTSD